MKTFYRLLGIALIVATTNNFVWFALTFWIYLTTKSVVSTSTLAGVFLVMSALSAVWFGSIVDHHKKKTAMLGSSIATLVLFAIGWLLLRVTPASAFATVASVRLWIFAAILLFGTIVGAIYNIAIPTLIGLTVPADRRDRANGMFGTVIGVAFGITSVASGVVLAFGGMEVVLAAAVAFTLLAILALARTPIPEDRVLTAEHQEHGKVDVKGTIRVVRGIPGLVGLIFFTTFNNLLGGVFFALMDAYGLSLVTVQVWGFLWGFLSLAFILGGLFVARRGVGRNPLRTLFRVNYVAWTVCIFFTVQPSIALLGVGVFLWMFVVPFIEAIEQTILQAVVPPERLGRVLGFAHSIEHSASPLSAFLIGPVAELVFIPFMTTGRGVELIGDWYGVGVGRGIALVFTTAGLIGFAVTALAQRSKAYRVLSQRYLDDVG